MKGKSTRKVTEALRKQRRASQGILKSGQGIDEIQVPPGFFQDAPKPLERNKFVALDDRVYWWTVNDHDVHHNIVMKAMGITNEDDSSDRAFLGDVQANPYEEPTDDNLNYLPFGAYSIINNEENEPPSYLKQQIDECLKQSAEQFDPYGRIYEVGKEAASKGEEPLSLEDIGYDEWSDQMSPYADMIYGSYSKGYGSVKTSQSNSGWWKKSSEEEPTDEDRARWAREDELMSQSDNDNWLSYESTLIDTRGELDSTEKYDARFYEGASVYIVNEKDPNYKQMGTIVSLDDVDQFDRQAYVILNDGSESWFNLDDLNTKPSENVDPLENLLKDSLWKGAIDQNEFDSLWGDDVPTMEPADDDIEVGDRVSVANEFYGVVLDKKDDRVYVRFITEGRTINEWFAPRALVYEGTTSPEELQEQRELSNVETGIQREYTENYDMNVEQGFKDITNRDNDPDDLENLWKKSDISELGGDEYEDDEEEIRSLEGFDIGDRVQHIDGVEKGTVIGLANPLGIPLIRVRFDGYDSLMMEPEDLVILEDDESLEELNNLWKGSRRNIDNWWKSASDENPLSIDQNFRKKDRVEFLGGKYYSQAAGTGTIEKVYMGNTEARYLINWDDGREAGMKPRNRRWYFDSELRPEGHEGEWNPNDPYAKFIFELDADGTYELDEWMRDHEEATSNTEGKFKGWVENGEMTLSPYEEDIAGFTPGHIQGIQDIMAYAAQSRPVEYIEVYFEDGSVDGTPEEVLVTNDMNKESLWKFSMPRKPKKVRWSRIYFEDGSLGYQDNYGYFTLMKDYDYYTGSEQMVWMAHKKDGSSTSVESSTDASEVKASAEYEIYQIEGIDREQQIIPREHIAPQEQPFSLEEVEVEIAKATGAADELGAIANESTGILLWCYGQGSRIYNPDQYIPYMEGSIFTHSHPTDKPFSESDIRTFASTGLAEMRAISPSYVHSMTWGSSGGLSWTEISKVFNEAQDEFMEDWFQPFDRGELSEDEAAGGLMNQAWEVAAERLGLNYARWSR